MGLQSIRKIFKPRRFSPKQVDHNEAAPPNAIMANQTCSNFAAKTVVAQLLLRGLDRSVAFKVFRIAV